MASIEEIKNLSLNSSSESGKTIIGNQNQSNF